MYRVLVVDDEEEIRDAVTRRLSREGFLVEQAASSEEAAVLIRETPSPYDVILTDMVMEDPAAGVKTLEAALSRDIFTEVLVLTAYGNVSNAVECMRRGAFDYVEKNMPGVDVYELLVLKLNQALDRRRASLQTLRRYADIAQREGIELASLPTGA